MAIKNTSKNAGPLKYFVIIKVKNKEQSNDMDFDYRNLPFVRCPFCCQGSDGVKNITGGYCVGAFSDFCALYLSDCLLGFGAQ
jgi:hypothetical protein